MKIIIVAVFLMGMLSYRLFGDGYLAEIPDAVITGVLIFLALSVFNRFMGLKRFYKKWYRLDI